MVSVHRALGNVPLGIGIDFASEHSIDDVPAQNLERLSDGAFQIRGLHDDFDLSDVVIAPPSRNLLNRNQGAPEGTLDNSHIANIVDVMFEHSIRLEDFHIAHFFRAPSPFLAREHCNTTSRQTLLNFHVRKKNRSRVASCPKPKHSPTILQRGCTFYAPLENLIPPIGPPVGVKAGAASSAPPSPAVAPATNSELVRSDGVSPWVASTSSDHRNQFAWYAGQDRPSTLSVSDGALSSVSTLGRDGAFSDAGLAAPSESSSCGLVEGHDLERKPSGDTSGGSLSGCACALPLGNDRPQRPASIKPGPHDSFSNPVSSIPPAPANSAPFSPPEAAPLFIPVDPGAAGFDFDAAISALESGWLAQRGCIMNNSTSLRSRALDSMSANLVQASSAPSSSDISST